MRDFKVKVERNNNDGTKTVLGEKELGMVQYTMAVYCAIDQHVLKDDLREAKEMLERIGKMK